MKVFQIVDGFCFKDITSLSNHHDLSKITALHYEEAPDYVFAKWGFDPDKEGDERFVKPIPPEGFIYNEENGCFEPENPDPIEPTVEDDLSSLLIDQEYRLTLLELGL